MLRLDGIYARHLESDELATKGECDAEGSCCMRKDVAPVRLLIHDHCIKVSDAVEVNDV